MDLDDKSSEIDETQDVSAPSADVNNETAANQADAAIAEADTPAASEEPTDVEITEAVLAKMRPAEEPEDPEPEPKKAEGEGEPKAEAEGDKAGKSESEEDVRLSDDEMKSLPGKTRKRIHTLTAQRYEARQEAETARKEAEEAETQLKELQPRAEAFDTIDKALTESNLSYEDLSNLVTVGQIIRAGDPAKVIEVLTPYWQDAQRALGNELTPEFQAKVDASELSVEAAQEAQRTHMTAQRTQQELDARKQAEQQQTQAQQDHDRLRQTLINVTNEEFAKVSAGNPDAQSLVPQMQQGIKDYVSQHGPVTDPQAARLLVQHVWGQVSAKAAAPTPPPRKATPPNPVPTGPTAAAPKEPVTATSILTDVLSRTRSA